MLYFPKSQPAPASLAIEKKKKSGTWRTQEVIDRISEDFAYKCYICGNKSTSFNVEHFVPHKENNDLKFSWNNLFLACAHCNNIKLAIFDNILDCTNINERCEDRIKYGYGGLHAEKPQIIALDDDVKTLMTVKLIDAVYNRTTLIKNTNTTNIVEEIQDDYLDFQKYLNRYYKKGFPEEYKKECLLKVQQHLHHTSKFTEFKRWAVRNVEGLKELEKYFI